MRFVPFISLILIGACCCPDLPTSSGSSGSPCGQGGEGGSCRLASVGAPLCGPFGSEPCASQHDCASFNGTFCFAEVCADSVGCQHMGWCAPQLNPDAPCTEDFECCSGLCLPDTPRVCSPPVIGIESSCI